jgi:hypothetical protein
VIDARFGKMMVDEKLGTAVVKRFILKWCDRILAWSVRREASLVYS